MVIGNTRPTTRNKQRVRLPTKACRSRHALINFFLCECVCNAMQLLTPSDFNPHRVPFFSYIVILITYYYCNCCRFLCLFSYVVINIINKIIMIRVSIKKNLIIFNRLLITVVLQDLFIILIIFNLILLSY